ncbi:O-antigen ligase family protein [Aromatoleum petrolei]|nr:O-antigen ligase family protein [Aromatoleum petrolei]
MSASPSSISHVIASFILALGWLLPNHYQPWVSFHSEAWVSIVLCVFAALPFLIYRELTDWHWLTLAIGALAIVPITQLWLGLIDFSGTALIGTIYLFGLALSVQAGHRWQQCRRDELGDILFLSIGIAGTASVGIQLHQWLGLVTQDSQLGLWMHQQIGSRPYGNLAQPNQLSTLLTWGVLASAWGFYRGFLRGSFAFLLACFLVAGIALTQSRTGALAILIISASTVYWRRSLPQRTFIATLSLTIVYIAFAFSISPACEFLQLEQDENPTERLSAGIMLRPAIWRMFIDAVSVHPLSGYGMNQVLHAQAEKMLEHPEAFSTAFGHSHNIFIDLLLWFGVPIGAIASVLLILWFVTSVRAIKRPEDGVLALFAIVIGVHSLLELPLHYAYFLLPTGMVIGMLNRENGRGIILRSSRHAFLTALLVTSSLLALSISDYFRIEAEMAELTLEKSWPGIQKGDKHPRNIFLLTQLREAIQLGRFAEHSEMSSEELDWVRKATTNFPSPSNLYKLSSAYALNGRKQDAINWLRRTCGLVHPKICEMAKNEWAENQEKLPPSERIAWPAQTFENTFQR